MKKALLYIGVTLTGLAGCIMAGAALYRWFTVPDTVRCIAHEGSFGCSTDLGWMLSGCGVVVVAAGIYLWDRYRNG